MTDRMNQLMKLLADDPANSFIKFAIAKEYEGGKSADLSTSQVELALDKYEELRQEDPAYVGLYYHYAKLLEKKNDFDKAIAIYKEGMSIAKEQGDKHAFGEMESALWEIEED